jgi:hypothetical protein
VFVAAVVAEEFAIGGSTECGIENRLVVVTLEVDIDEGDCSISAEAMAVLWRSLKTESLAK